MSAFAWGTLLAPKVWAGRPVLLASADVGSAPLPRFARALHMFPWTDFIPPGMGFSSAALGAPRSLCRSETRRRCRLKSCTRRALKVLFPGLGLYCLVYLTLLSRSSSDASYLQQQTTSLAQAATVSRQLKELSVTQFSFRDLQSAFITAGQLTQSFQLSAARQHAATAQEESAEFQMLVGKARHILTVLATAKPTVRCKLDSTLLSSMSDGGSKILLAANMHDNEDLLPHFTLQMLDLLSSRPSGSAFLSIYESGSTDRTGAWLEVLKDLMVCLGIPHKIIVGGSLTRGKHQDRIGFLAQARNRALEPLWLSTAHSASKSAHQMVGEAPPAKNDVHAVWQAEHVVFLNDVYFCAQDVLRLLEHNADMVCGMDFDKPEILRLPRQEQRALFAQYMRHAYMVPLMLGRWLGRSGLVTKHWRFNPATQAAFQAQAALGFYDTWVARDSDGNPFLKSSPFVTDPYSLERIAKGLPFPVKCCWNGLVVMKAAPFSRFNLRVRMHQEGECAASECSLVCNDFQRLGYRNILVDPGVRQAYDALDAKELYDNVSMGDLPYTAWADVVAAPAVNWELVPHRPYSKCCGLPEGYDVAEIDQDCFWDNFMQPNYTAMSL